MNERVHSIWRRLRAIAGRASSRLRSAHADQRGTISILTVFVLLSFTMLLMLMFNIAKQYDDKVRMQNAADASTYSGGVVLARGMNSIAFANHLEADVFALTAFLREARDRNAESYVPEILAKWVETGSLFAGSAFPKFQPLTGAIAQTAPLEQQFVTAWSELAASAARDALPTFEHILGTPETMGPGVDDHLIPIFQRAVVQSTPTLAQEVTLEMAMRHGLRQENLEQLQSQMRDNPQFAGSPRGPQVGLLWRMSVEPVGLADEFDPLTRTLPVVDPDRYLGDYTSLPNAQKYLEEARKRRSDLAHRYLADWIRDRDPRRGLDFADEEARMSQFARLFWTAACAQLDKLLNEEFPTSNVPFILRSFDQPVDNRVLEDSYTYVGVVYRRHVDESADRMYRNPLDASGDAATFAQITLFIPRPRFYCCPWILPRTGEDANSGEVVGYYARSDAWSGEWSTFNQNWNVQLMPATADAIPDILSTNPGGPLAGVRTQNLRGASMQDIHPINTH